MCSGFFIFTYQFWICFKKEDQINPKIEGFSQNFIYDAFPTLISALFLHFI